MELSVLIATAGFMLALVGATVAGVWTVGTVRATANETATLLAAEIRALRDGIAEFKAEVRAALDTSGELEVFGQATGFPRAATASFRWTGAPTVP